MVWCNGIGIYHKASKLELYLYTYYSQAHYKPQLSQRYNSMLQSQIWVQMCGMPHNLCLKQSLYCLLFIMQLLTKKACQPPSFVKIILKKLPLPNFWLDSSAKMDFFTLPILMRKMGKRGEGDMLLNIKHVWSWYGCYLHFFIGGQKWDIIIEGVNRIKTLRKKIISPVWVEIFLWNLRWTSLDDHVTPS